MASSGSQADTAVPSLKVMRLQKPDLHMPTAGTLQTNSLLGPAMCLPDSFGVIHVGETFTAYLGALNVSKSLNVTKLTCTAQLQTPSQRWHLASTLDEGNASGGVEIPPESGVDAIVSHALEEPGQHILRVEVGYAGGDGSIKTLRKFYRFQVSNPLRISELTFRSSDVCCYVSVSLENNVDEAKGGLTICEAEFEAADGLTAEQIGKLKGPTFLVSGTEMFDSSGRLEAGHTLRYLFRVQGERSGETAKGIAVSDELGKAIFTWRKACGEMGRIASAPIVLSPMASPFIDPNNPGETMEGTRNPFVVHCKGRSGLSVDVASAAAARSANQNRDRNTLDQRLPVTVEPIDPPSTIELGIPFQIDLLIINHSDREMALQLQFHLQHMTGVSVCGTSFKNLQDVPGRGGSVRAVMAFVPFASGLLQIAGCSVVDLDRGLSFPQPPLCQIIVQSAPEQ